MNLTPIENAFYEAASSFIKWSADVLGSNTVLADISAHDSCVIEITSLKNKASNVQLGHYVQAVVGVNADEGVDISVGPFDSRASALAALEALGAIGY